MSSTKKRAPNYSLREKEILLALVKKYFHVLENKKTNAAFNKEKSKCWEKVAWEFNSLQNTGPRTAVQLKSSYEQLKKHAKQHAAEDKVEVLKTGGGMSSLKVTSIDEKILDLIKTNYFNIENSYDSNGEFDVEQQKKEPSSSSGKAELMEVKAQVHNSVVSNNMLENMPHVIMVYEDSEQDSQFISQGNDNDNVDTILEDLTNLEDVSARKIPNFNSSSLKTVVQHISEHVNAEDQPENSVNVSINTGAGDHFLYRGTKGKKRKVPLTSDILKKKDRGSFTEILSNKKLQLLHKKEAVLDMMQKVEKENLQGKVLENEIKAIIKERELIELEIKKHEYENLKS